jgi:hypothetical protein
MPTAKYGLRYPSLADAPNGPSQLQTLAEDVEGTLADGLLAWKAYTPVWTSSSTYPLINNGSATGRYCQLGHLVIFNATITVGSTTTLGSGFYQVSLPPGLTSATTGTSLVSAYFLDQSASETDKHHVGIGRIPPASSIVERIYVVGASTSGLPWSPTSPVVPAVDDKINLSGTYETSVAP